MNEKQSVASASVSKEIQTLVRHWDEIDKSKLIGLEPDEGQKYAVQDGEIEVIRVDDIKKRIASVDLSNFVDIEIDLDFDDEDSLPYDSDGKRCLPPDVDSELADKKMYGKKEIMMVMGFGNQKALYFLKLLFQMGYAGKYGRSYMIKPEELNRFLEESKGKEIAIWPV